MAVNLSFFAGAGAQFFDNNGVPLAGGLIYTYLAGTTTPSATYTSSTGLIAHSNPIVLDSAGRVATGEIWVTADLSYKFVLKDSTGVQIGSYDNVPSYLTLSSANITYTPSGSGAVTSNVQTKLREFVSVKDFGAIGNGVTNDTAAFNLAAATGTTVYVPAGSYLISAPTSSAFWYLQDGAIINGLPDVNPGSGGGVLNDTSRLTGKIFNIVNYPSETGIRIGDSDPWLEKTIRPFTETISELVVLSESGQIAVLGASRSSDDLVANYATIGVSGYGINNNTTNPEPTWASYFEARRTALAGAAYCSEMDMVNNGTTFDLTPLTSISPTTGQTANLWLSSGGGDAEWGGNTVSAAMVVLPNPSTFKRGIVFRNGSLDETTNEAIAAVVGYQFAWYNLSNIKNSFIDHRQISQLTEDNTILGSFWQSKKRRNTGAQTTALDYIHKHEFYGCSGSSTDYVSGYYQNIQRSNFAAGNARFSYDVMATNSDGSPAVVSLNSSADNTYTPGSDNTISLGVALARWSVVYAATGAINTSDANEKTQIRDITAQEKAVALIVKSKLKAFKYKDAVAAKGANARIHFGVIAQDVKAAFESEGLVAEDYGVFCSDTWLDENEIQRTRLGVRYDELFAFVLGAM